MFSPPPRPLRCGSTNHTKGLDLDALGIVQGKFCWVVFVDILVLQARDKRNETTVLQRGERGRGRRKRGGGWGSGGGRGGDLVTRTAELSCCHSLVTVRVVNAARVGVVSPVLHGPKVHPLPPSGARLLILAVVFWRHRAREVDIFEIAREKYAGNRPVLRSFSARGQEAHSVYLSIYCISCLPRPSFSL